MLSELELHQRIRRYVKALKYTDWFTDVDGFDKLHFIHVIDNGDDALYIKKLKLNDNAFRIEYRKRCNRGVLRGYGWTGLLDFVVVPTRIRYNKGDPDSLKVLYPFFQTSVQ